MTATYSKETLADIVNNAIQMFWHSSRRRWGCGAGARPMSPGVRYTCIVPLISYSRYPTVGVLAPRLSISK